LLEVGEGLYFTAQDMLRDCGTVLGVLTAT